MFSIMNYQVASVCVCVFDTKVGFVGNNTSTVADWNEGWDPYP